MTLSERTLRERHKAWGFGMESTVPLSRKFYIGGEGPFKELALTTTTWVQATDTHDAEAATAAHIDSITGIGFSSHNLAAVGVLAGGALGGR
eukprot:COSAG06_NODE_250_length_19080_cov_6.483029_19_plen_92_part_00